MNARVMAAMMPILLLAGCSTASPATTPTSPATKGAGVQIVVIGDSLADTANHCPGCTGFLETFRDHIEESLGASAEATLLLGMTIPDAQSMVASDEKARQVIADADVIIVQTGFNNVIPDPTTGIGCGGSLDGGVDVWVSTTTTECLDAGVATYGDLYQDMLNQLKELRDGKSTVVVVMNTVDGNIAPDDPNGMLAYFQPDKQEWAKQWTVEQYERWNAMLADEARAAGASLVDLYHAFNGPDGTTPFGSLSVDGAHPSQEGNDLIARMLAEVDLSTLTG
ncbi:SGNH/GDSL hydrolase family protein [Aeromicrobium sp.]|uniref:SGNH/GDSL hydrolase family protein n=1 Tax=Aeromicrobium sp. TaxID=1871063 RepID=UPI0019BAB50E|nr:SGNH/GDSL hydrolase family protein [Aeromicrobium sp.]MBC7633495.1 SGNH/GDSL hydrolase family protein [Aeromicrobium sp.]